MLRDKITSENKNRFYGYLFRAMMKLDTDKNRRKPPMSKQTIKELVLHLAVETEELKLAEHINDPEELQTECFDIINLAMGILDKINGVDD